MIIIARNSLFRLGYRKRLESCLGRGEGGGLNPPRILYCHCQYAQVVPPEVKADVLQGLCQSGAPFDAVADLCEMAARKDPSLRQLATEGPLKIAACFPRAVKGLFHQAGSPLAPDRTEILNLRTESAAAVTGRLLAPDLLPNVPTRS